MNKIKKPSPFNLVLAAVFLLANALWASAQTIYENYQKIDQLISTNPHLALNELAKINHEELDTTTRAMHFITQSQAYIGLAYPNKALKAADTALSLLPDRAPQNLYFQVLMTKSQAMEMSGLAAEALPLAESVVQWAETNDPVLYIDALIGLGYIENTLGNYLDALNAFMKAYNMAPESGTQNTSSAIAGSVALVYEYRGENELAIPFFEESVAYHRQQNSPLELSISLYGLGRANKNIGNVELGQSQLNESLTVSRSIGDTQGVAYALKEMAPYFIEQEAYQEAKNMLQEAIDIFAESENRNMLLDAHKTMSVLLLKMNLPNAASKQLETAKSYLLAERMPNQALSLQEIETKIMAAQGQHQAAYEKLLSTGQKKQQLQAQQSTQSLHQLRAQFELESKEKANLLLAQENSEQKLLLLQEAQQKQVLILILVAACSIVLILIMAAVRNNRQKSMLYHLANFDPLTKLPNRTHTFEKLKQSIKQLNKQESLHVVMLDLDNFKSINDQLGHDKGDEVLSATGNLFKRSLQNPDFAGRFGGEEFLLVLHQTNLEAAERKIGQIRIQYQKEIAQLLTHHELNNYNIQLGFSAGIAILNSEDDIKKSIKEADSAMYSAKNSGRNRTVGK